MKRVSVFAMLGAIIAVALVGTLGMPVLSGGKSAPVVQAQNQPYLAIDADLTNGNRPCDPIDDEATAGGIGAQHTVGVCLVDHAAAEDPIPTFVVDISYDETKYEGVEESGGEPYFLDVNPDANDGSGSDKLGTDWTCDPIPGLSIPPSMGPPAHIECWTIQGTKALTADPGLIATLTFTVVGLGDDVLTFDSTSEIYASYCNENMPCPGATIHAAGAPVEGPDSSNGNGKGNVNGDGNGNGGRVAVIAVGAIAGALVLGTALWYARRRWLT